MVQRPCKPVALDAASLGGQVQRPSLPLGAITVIPDAAKPRLVRAHTGTLGSAGSPVAGLAQQQTPCAGGPQPRLMRARTASLASTPSHVSASPLSSQASVASSVPSYPPGMGWTPLAAAGRLPVFFAGSVTPTGYLAAHAIPTPSSVAKPYPPGLGYTPHANATTLTGSLQRRGTFGLSVEGDGQIPAAVAPARSPAGGLLRKQTSNLASVLEASVEDRQLSREFLLCFRGEPEPTEAAEAGFLWPAPGFILTREEAEPTKAAKLPATAAGQVAGPAAAPAGQKPQGGMCNSYLTAVKQGYPVQHQQWQQQKTQQWYHGQQRNAWASPVQTWQQQKGYQGHHNQYHAVQGVAR